MKIIQEISVKWEGGGSGRGLKKRERDYSIRETTKTLKWKRIHR